MNHIEDCDENCPEQFCDRCDLSYPECVTYVDDLEGDGDVIGGTNKVYVPTYKCPECGDHGVEKPPNQSAYTCRQCAKLFFVSDEGPLDGCCSRDCYDVNKAIKESNHAHR